MSLRFGQWCENLKIPWNSPRGEGLRPEFRSGSCAARNVQNNMACRDGFVSNGSVLEQYSSTVVANLGERRVVFFASFSHFWCVRECLSVVWLFFLSSPNFDHADSDSEHERFWKILSQKFEWASGLTHVTKIQKLIKIFDVVTVWCLNFATDLGCAHCSKSIWLLQTVLEVTVPS